MVVRAVTKNKKGQYSEVVSENYFVTTKDLIKYKNAIVISLLTDPEIYFLLILEYMSQEQCFKNGKIVMNLFPLQYLMKD